MQEHILFFCLLREFLYRFSPGPTCQVTEVHELTVATFLWVHLKKKIEDYCSEQAKL